MTLVQTHLKLEVFFAVFSRKTRVVWRAAHAKRIGIAARATLHVHALRGGVYSNCSFPLIIAIYCYL